MLRVPGGLGPHLVSGLQPFDFLGVRTWACIVPDEQARLGPIQTQANIVRAFSALKALAEARLVFIHGVSSRRPACG